MTHAPNTPALAAVDKLVNALRTHLRDTALPGPAHIQLNLTTAGISAQIHHARSHKALADLLLWAYSLQAVTAGWWRTPTASLHITVRGRTTAGIHVQVYTGLSWSDCADLVPLADGRTEGVSLDELYRLAEQLRAREVAP